MSECVNRKFEKLLYPYELGMLDSDQRRELELHLMDCDSCADKVAQLQSAARMLREDNQIRDELESLAEIEAVASLTETDENKTTTPLRRFLRIGFAAAAVLAFLLIKPWNLDIQTDQPAVASTNRLVIMPFDDLSQTQSSRSGEVVSSLLITDLSQSAFVNVVSSQRMNDIKTWLEFNLPDLPDQDRPSAMAERAQADFILSGKIIRDSSGIRLISELTEYPSGKLVGSQVVPGSIDDGMFALVDLLTVKVKNDLSLPTAALDESDWAVADVTTHSEEAYMAYLEALDYMAKMYAVEAVASLKQCISFDSTFAMAYYHLAEQQDRNYIDQAVQYSQNATVRERLYIDSRAASLRGDSEAARGFLQELLDRYPEEKDALYRLALLEYADSEWEETIRLLNQVLRIDPLHKMALNHLAYSYDASGDLDKAIEAINRYIRLAPNEANPYDSRGEIYAHYGQVDEAISSYQKALEKKPDFQASQTKLGHMYLMTNQLDLARSAYEQLMAQGTSGGTVSGRLYLVYVDIAEGRLAEALEGVDRAIADSRADPAIDDNANWPSFSYLRAMIYEELGQIERALEQMIDAFHIYQRSQPGSWSSYTYSVAYYQAKLGDNQAAQQTLDSIYAYYQRAGTEPISYVRAQGLVAFANNDPANAIRFLSEIVKNKQPFQEFYGYHYLAQANLMAENYAAAASQFEGLLEAYMTVRIFAPTKHVQLHYLLGQCYEGLDRTDDAILQYELFLGYWRDADPLLASVEDAILRLNRLNSQS